MAHPVRVARLALLVIGVAVVAACATRAAPAAVPERYGTVAEYRAARERLIQEDRGRRLGAGLVLTAAEEAANTRLMALKQAELDRTRDYFPPAHSFLRERTKEAMAGSRVLEVMRRLPKGGVLHAHGGALGDFRWVVANVTYRADCYMYVGPAAADAPPRGTLRLADKRRARAGAWCASCGLRPRIRRRSMPRFIVRSRWARRISRRRTSGSSSVRSSAVSAASFLIRRSVRTTGATCWRR